MRLYSTSQWKFYKKKTSAYLAWAGMFLPKENEVKIHQIHCYWFHQIEERPSGHSITKNPMITL